RTANGVVKGKVAYLSPEVIDGAAPDRRADVFALGTSLWEMSVDRRLFKQENDVETVRAIHNAKIPDPRTLVPNYPDALWAVLSRALERDVALRYPTAAEMSRALDACVEVNGRTVNNMSVAAMMAQLSA
ncbi:MAG: serine/threonine protein kinase, partial [Polyangiaceae bacterium]